jgi:hypothetical protein
MPRQTLNAKPPMTLLELPVRTFQICTSIIIVLATIMAVIVRGKWIILEELPWGEMLKYTAIHRSSLI